jgi:hypothetical protein
MLAMYLRSQRSPALLGCNSCQYRPMRHAALRGLGSLRAIGDASGAGLPAGTVLAYSASWPGSSPSRTIDSRPNTVQAAIQGTLAGKWGIVIDGQSHTTSDVIHIGGYSMILQLHTTSDYGSQDDVQRIIDGEIYNYLQAMPVSTIRVVQSVQPSPVSLTQQFPASTAANVAAAQAGYADAVARGDTASASQFAAEIERITGKNPIGTGAGITNWIADNWLWLAIGGAGVLIAREVL